MVRGSAVSQLNPSTLTHGQLLWIVLNSEIDYDERRAGQCGECRAREDSPTTRICGTCGKQFVNLVDSGQISEEQRKEIQEAAELARSG